MGNKEIRRYFGTIDESVFQLSDAQRIAFGKGSGHELLPKIVNNRSLHPKMCAVYSSSALVANMFGPFAETVGTATFWNNVLGLGRFFNEEVLPGCFEKCLRVRGVSGFAPNLDFYIHSGNRIVGVESKYREMYTRHRKQTVQQQYFDEHKFLYWDQFPGLKKTAEEVGSYSRLGAAQLVKHALALISEAKKTRDGKYRLVYVYHPIEDECVRRKHDDELARFKKECGLGRHFISISYAEYWERLLQYSMLFPMGYGEFVSRRYPILACRN